MARFSENILLLLTFWEGTPPVGSFQQNYFSFYRQISVLADLLSHALDPEREQHCEPRSASRVLTTLLQEAEDYSRIYTL
jgi:hypothetical protein